MSVSMTADASRCGSDVWEAWAKDARIALAALDAMGDEK